jgi:hypothetical protein
LVKYRTIRWRAVDSDVTAEALALDAFRHPYACANRIRDEFAVAA